jgi:hypothetical protein
MNIQDFWAITFTEKVVLFNLPKCDLGYISVYFFTQTSGHLARECSGPDTQKQVGREHRKDLGERKEKLSQPQNSQSEKREKVR